MGERPWTLQRGDGEWHLLDGSAAAPRAALNIAADEIPNLLTRGPNTAAATTTYEGDVDLAVAVGIGLAS